MPSEFAEQVYAILKKKVPRGKVTTYKALAEAVGTKAYQAIGQVMNKNPYAPNVPCHRVIASDGSIGGFATGTKKKRALLKQEGIRFSQGKVNKQQILRNL